MFFVDEVLGSSKEIVIIRVIFLFSIEEVVVDLVIEKDYELLFEEVKNFVIVIE